MWIIQNEEILKKNQEKSSALFKQDYTPSALTSDICMAGMAEAR